MIRPAAPFLLEIKRSCSTSVLFTPVSSQMWPSCQGLWRVWSVHHLDVDWLSHSRSVSPLDGSHPCCVGHWRRRQHVRPMFLSEGDQHDMSHEKSRRLHRHLRSMGMLAIAINKLHQELGNRVKKGNDLSDSWDRTIGLTPLHSVAE